MSNAKSNHMTPLFIKNIKGLVGCHDRTTTKLKGKDMNVLPVIENAYLRVENGKIASFGPMSEAPASTAAEDRVVDAAGRFVLPSWCDSHTHLVFAATRELEFEDRIKGLTYAEIAARGGGILNSAARLKAMSEDELFESALRRLEIAAKMGTGAMEIKSGYGLTLEAEMKMLRVVKRLKEHSDVAIRATLLGAHALPPEFKDNPQAYINIVLEEMIPAAAEEGLAEYVDVFCEKGYFDLEQTLAIVEKGAEYGLKAKVHVNQFNAMGAIPELVAAGAVSVDHLEVLGEGDAEALGGSETIATALPLCSMFLGLPYTPANQLMQAGAAVAIATDYNPGTAPSQNMNLAVSLACIKMKMTPEAAINAATINGAAAMDLADTHGSITVGKAANLLISEPCEHLSHLPYSFGRPAIETVVLAGKVLQP